MGEMCVLCLSPGADGGSGQGGGNIDRDCRLGVVKIFSFLVLLVMQHLCARLNFVEGLAAGPLGRPAPDRPCLSRVRGAQNTG